MTRRLVSLFAASALLGAAACTGAAITSQPAAEAPQAAGGPVRFVQEVRAEADLDAQGREGVLQLDDAGCFRVGQDGPALVWPAEAALDLAEPGVVRVHHRATGASVRVGERVWISGTAAGPQGLAETNRPLGPCAGPLVDVAEFEPRVVTPAKNARRALFPFA